jgi:putative acetyltransferase
LSSRATVNARDYTPEQLDAWAPEWSAEERQEQVKKLKLLLRKNISYVADMGGQVVGFADITKDGYLNRMFVHKNHQGQGIASALLRVLEYEMTQLGVTEIHTDASITAKPFFERHGFVTVQPQTVTVRGVSMVNFKMVKAL